jgi:hypothetical protein
MRGWGGTFGMHASSESLLSVREVVNRRSDLALDAFFDHFLDARRACGIGNAALSSRTPWLRKKR